MISREVARRYAVALYDLAAETGRVTETEGELARFVAEIDEVPDATTYLVHPLVSRERKKAFLDAAFPGLGESVRGLLGILIRNGREDHLRLVAEEYGAVRTAREGTAHVEVTSAVPLDDNARQRLTKRLAEVLGRPVECVERVDSGLIGGARIDVDGAVVDGTLRGRLTRLAERLEG